MVFSQTDVGCNLKRTSILAFFLPKIGNFEKKCLK